MSDFSIDIGSDQEHEDLIAEILLGGEVVAVVSQESGPGVLEIKINGRLDGQPWMFPLADFERAVEAARQRLLELRKDRSPRRP